MIAPITTLPSISEDEELGEEGEKPASAGQTDDGSDAADHANKEHASSLPLLSKMSRVPNGDIQGVHR